MKTMNKTEIEPDVTDIIEMMDEADTKREIAKTRETGLKLGFADLTPVELAAIDTDKLAALLAMKRSEEDRQAEREFYDALSKFQSECPIIKRTKEVKTKTGAHAFDYAPYEDIKREVGPLMAKHGFSSKMTQLPDRNGFVVVECTIGHRGGHREKSEFACPIGVSNNLTTAAMLRVGANTTAKRNAFLDAMDIACEDMDVQSSCETVQVVTQDQADRLRELVDQLSDGARGRFFAWVGASDCDSIPAAKFDAAELALGKAVRKEAGDE